MTGDKESFERGRAILADEVGEVLAQIRALCETPLQPGEVIMAVSFGLMIGGNETPAEYKGHQGVTIETEFHLSVAGAPMGIGILTQELAREGRRQIHRRNAGGDIREDVDDDDSV